MLSLMVTSFLVLVPLELKSLSFVHIQRQVRPENSLREAEKC